MGTCALRLFVLAAMAPVALVAFAAGGVQSDTSTSKVGHECNVSIQLPADTQVERDSGAPPAICSLVEKPKAPSPFVNTLMVIPWSGLDSLKVNGEPLEEIGFYSLSPNRTARFSGRPSYDDPRSGYRQRVLRASRTTLKRGATTTESNFTELRVNWLRPLDARQSEEVSQDYICVDAASKDEAGVLLFNWCELRSQQDRVAILKKASKSLKRARDGQR